MRRRPGSLDQLGAAIGQLMVQRLAPEVGADDGHEVPAERCGAPRREGLAPQRGRHRRDRARMPGRAEDGHATGAGARGNGDGVRPSRLAKVVFRPRRRFVPMGSAATSARVGTHSIVGTTSTSTSLPPRHQLVPGPAEPALGVEDVRAAEGRSPGDHLAHDVVDPFGAPGEQRAEDRRAIGEPRAAVQEVADLVERGQVHLRHLMTGRRRASRASGSATSEAATVNGPTATGHGPPPSTDSTTRPSATEVVKVEMQSMVGLAGWTPSRGRDPGAPFMPTTPHMAAGTRPEPAVSVPRANATWCRATATADPDDEPPGM